MNNIFDLLRGRPNTGVPGRFLLVGQTSGDCGPWHGGLGAFRNEHFAKKWAQSHSGMKQWVCSPRRDCQSILRGRKIFLMPEAMVCIFVKPPEPGAVKARLIPELGPQRTAELAEAFLEDTVAMVRTLPWAECIIAATKTFARPYFKPEEVWLQSEGDLGERLEKVLRLALKRKPLVLAIGGDSPGLPAAYLESARQALKTADAVLGPSADGGFYLMGLKDCPVGVLDGIQWSHSTTLAATVHKLEQFGMKTVLIDPWFDIDSPQDLERLRRQLANDPAAAPRTAEMLSRSSPPNEASPGVKPPEK